MVISVYLQHFRCCVFTNQEQDTPLARYRPRQRECTLYPHTQEDPQVPAAFCKSHVHMYVLIFFYFNKNVWFKQMFFFN